MATVSMVATVRGPVEVDKLKQLKDAGVDTIVDPTVVGLGRYIPRVQQVNAQVDINIIAATGLYTFDEIPHYFHYRGPGTILDGPELMTEMFVRDIRDGIGGTGVRAAFLKCVAEERGLTPDQTRVQAAICEAHQETGAPITVHTNAAHQTGRLALDFYAQHGVNLTKVVVGHAGDSNDLDYLKWIMDQGATIGCDRFGLDMYNPTEDRVRTIAALCAQGYADRIVLSHDASCYMDFFSGEQSQAMLRQAVPNWHYLHIPNDVLPALRKEGVTEYAHLWIRLPVALAASPLLDRALLVVNQHSDADDLGKRLLCFVEAIAMPNLHPAREPNPAVTPRILGGDDDAVHTFGRQQAGHLGYRPHPDRLLAAGHGDRGVVEQLERDLRARSKIT